MAKREPLTERETEIIKLVWEGLTSKEIGEKLKMSYRTVDVHRVNIMKKYETTNMIQMLRIALKEKIIKA